MSDSDGPYLYSSEREPHRNRTLSIVTEHPEIRGLTGHNPYTFLFIVGLVLAQVGLASLAQGRSWWVILVLAYVVGAVLSHALYVLMHECNHDLVFERHAANSLAGILANLPTLVPSAVSFQRYHLKHHSYQGVHDLDGDLPGHWEARLVGTGTVRKALWMLLFPVFLTLRPAHLRGMRHVCGWTVLNVGVVLAFDVLLWRWLGPGAFAYLFLSMFFALGLHPLGARWISEHYVFSPMQETYSYYGPLNRVAFNIGYHNEHHDFPRVPWNRIPRVKELAPEWYEGLISHRSWTGLLVEFIRNPRMGLHCRVHRTDRGLRPTDPGSRSFVEATDPS